VRLSTRARYALRLMLDVAKNGKKGVPVSLGLVAERTDLSRGYLEQLATALKNARLLKGTCGKQGGYHLTRTPKEITLREIIEAVSGPLLILDCVEDATVCDRADYCECRLVYALINQRIVEVLEEFTLADMVDPRWNASMAKVLSDMESRRRCQPVS
jgi:Rrf2 family transcriptional regulator, cysteine metabolism repressor